METMTLNDVLSTYSSQGMTWEIEFKKIRETQKDRHHRLMESIRVEGIKDPIVINPEDEVVYDGYHRLCAAQDLGLTEIPVDLNSWTEW